MMKQEFNEIRIPVTVGGITFKNPFYVASGPTTKSVRQLVRIEETGWAAASIKLSIDPAPYINRKPRYSLFKDRNALAFTAEKRLTFEEGLRLVSEAKPKLHDLKLMANITYAGDDGPRGWVNMAKRFEAAGADIIELNMCCPNMSYNLEMTSGGSEHAAKQTGASMGQHADIAAEIVEAIKKELRIPLFVKLTPEGGQIAQVAKALYAAGADAVGGTGNRLGMPPIDLDDPGKAFYHLQKEISMGCYSSGWLKPLAQRDTYEIRKVCGNEVPVTATGGIRNWKDAVEMVLCGGTLLGICAETLISGYDIVRPMIAGLHEYMEEHGYESLDQMRGLVVPQMRTATDVTLYAGYARIKDPNLSAPCKSACPLHVPAQAYIQKVAAGDYRAAYDLITERNPLQNLCALACAHPCEDACVRGGYDSPVKIKEIKRFVLDYGRRQGWEPAWAAAKPNGHKAAVIGSGPSGLACAAELAKGGYEVTVFEKDNEAGGRMRFGIPDYALPAEAIDTEVEFLCRQGIRFCFGQDVTEEELRKNGFDGVYVSGGSENADTGGKTDMLKGAEYAGSALAYLKELNGGGCPKTEECVTVIGDGYDAADAARSAVRLGAKKVMLLRRMPGKLSYDREVLALAREEGVAVLEGAEVLEILPGKIRLEQAGILMELSCGQVLIGTGSKAGNIAAAIAAGKNGAAAIDRRIMGENGALKPVGEVRTVSLELVRKRTGYLKRDPNPVRLNRPAEERIAGFEFQSRVMTEEEARKEAARCLNCGCGEGCQLCKTICTDFAPEISDTDTMHIRREECVACGMCYNRCPNGNIEMVDLGQQV